MYEACLESDDLRFVHSSKALSLHTLTHYTMLTSLTCKSLILSGGRGCRPGRRQRQYSTFAPPRTHAPVTNPRQGRRTRQLLSGRGGCKRGQMSASVSHKYISSSSSSEERPSLSVWTLASHPLHPESSCGLYIPYDTSRLQSRFNLWKICIAEVVGRPAI